jgi:uncharacterized protein
MRLRRMPTIVRPNWDTWRELTAKGGVIVNEMRRRDFLQKVGAGVVGGAIAASALATETQAPNPTTRPGGDKFSPVGTIRDLPRRRLGKIGIEVPPFSIGTAPMGQAFYEPEPFEAVLNAALDAGVVYVDTARIYDVAEDRLRPILAKRRKEVFLVTKAWARTRDDALRTLETSLSALGVDYVDLGHLHNVGQYERDEVLGKGGLLEGLLEARKRGWVKHIGCTGHINPKKLVEVIETGEIEAVMTAMNFVDRNTYSFEETVLPTARKHGCAIIPMKVYGGVTGTWDGYKNKRPGRLAGDDKLRQYAVDYALSIPGVSTCVVGVKSLEELRLTIQAFRNHKPLEGPRREEVLALGRKMATEWGPHFG